MTPSDVKRKIVLDFLFEHNHQVDSQIFRQLFEFAKEKEFSYYETALLVNQMDNEQGHEGLLQIKYPLDPQGFGVLNTSLATTWISLKGEDYLDNLNNPQEIPSTINQTFQVTNNGNASFGNNNENSFSDDHSVNKVNVQVDKLLTYKSKFDSASDQANLEELANSLRQLLTSDEVPKPGALKKFGGFINKTWSIIQPVAAPLLVQLAMKGFFN